MNSNKKSFKTAKIIKLVLFSLLFIGPAFPHGDEGHEAAKPAPEQPKMTHTEKESHDDSSKDSHDESNKDSHDSGHGGEEEVVVIPQWALKEINKNYQVNVKPIFKRTCFDCHGKMEYEPWEYHIPGVTQLMDYDMKEAKVHLDMVKDFPFGGHGGPANDLKAIREAIVKGDMPPWYYMLNPRHWGDQMTDTEVDTVLEWIDSSEAILGTLKGNVDNSCM